MKNITIMLILILVYSCNINTKKKKDVTSEAFQWHSLFDGKTFDGWHLYNGGSPEKTWTIEEGAMKFTPPKERKEGIAGFNIITDEAFSSFELSLEWKISKAGNSGIFWGVVESADYSEPYFTAPEIQVLDMGNPKYDPAAEKENAYYEAGALYDLVKPSEQAAHPAGMWNHVLLHIDHGNNRGYVELNEKRIVQFPVHGPEWDKMIQSSKFKDWTHFGKAHTGKIGLQDHGDEVWYRDIKLRKLP